MQWWVKHSLYTISISLKEKLNNFTTLWVIHWITVQQISILLFYLGWYILPGHVDFGFSGVTYFTQYNVSRCALAIQHEKNVPWAATGPRKYLETSFNRSAFLFIFWSEGINSFVLECLCLVFVEQTALEVRDSISLWGRGKIPDQNNNVSSSSDGWTGLLEDSF